jgi:hypothetical protein
MILLFQFGNGFQIVRIRVQKDVWTNSNRLFLYSDEYVSK